MRLGSRFGLLLVLPLALHAACASDPRSARDADVKGRADAAATQDGGAAGDGGVTRAPRGEEAQGGKASAQARRAAFDAISQKQACRMPRPSHASALAGIAPFTRENGTCGDMLCDVVEAAPKGADACFVAQDNIARAERAMRSTPASRPARGGASEGQAPPRFADRVDSHLHLTTAERALLAKNQFVVLDRLGYSSYGVAFHDVFQQQLPVYVGVDAIFQAVFHANETLLGEIETKQLGPRLATMIEKLRLALLGGRGAYDPETVRDLDVYLQVAHRLLHGRDEHPRSLAPLHADNEELVAKLVTNIVQPGGLLELELFGRRRVIDFSMYQPRGHYTSYAWEDNIKWRGKDIPRDAYFRAVTWLSRLELNLVSRSCASSAPALSADPTPREARVALALADLVGRAGVSADLARFEQVYAVFAGRREDVSVADLRAIAARAKIGVRDESAPAALEAAIGGGFVRTARTHFQPDGTRELPVIFTLLGPRIGSDVEPLTSLVTDAIAGREVLGAADIGYLLGHDRAREALAGELAAYPDLGPALDAGRAAIARGAKGKQDVYATWLSATLRLAEPPNGVAPTFMRTPAYADMRMSSALAAYAQLRHTFVLLTGQGYDSYGCEIPDGWVEPAVGAYDGLLAWARTAKAVVPHRAAYFRRVEEILGMLRAISVAELEGRPLTEPQRRWLGMIAEYTPVDGYGDSGSPPLYTGWYFDLFPDREIGATHDVGIVADTVTLTTAGKVHYLGVEKTALGVFVVDTGGEPRMMVGPVVKPYETSSPIDGRLDDEAAAAKPAPRAPWLSYLADARPDPSLSVRAFACDGEARVLVQGESDLGDVSITLLDHHGDPIAATETHPVSTTPSVFSFELPQSFLDAKFGVEGVHVHVHKSAPAPVGPDRWDAVLGLSVWVPNAPRKTAPGTPEPWQFQMPVMDVEPGSFFDAAFGSAKVPRERR